MTNYVFSRRTIQQILDALAESLDAGAMRDLVSRIERPGDDRLPAMWEAIWLRELASAGDLGHEVPLSNGKRPDFTLTLSSEAGNWMVVGEITGVSDKGLHDENPVRQFWEALVKLAQQCGVDPGRLRYNIGAQMVGDYPNRKQKLLLPARGAIASFLKTEVRPFLIQIAKQPTQQHRKLFTAEGVQFNLGYDPSQEFGGGGHAAYDTPYSLRRNPIFTALSKKARQLASAPKDQLRVVILCDCGCSAMRRTSLTNVGGSLSGAQIVQRYIAKRPGIDAVIMTTVEDVSPYDTRDRRLRLALELIATNDPEKQSAVQALSENLRRMLTSLPTPVLEPYNAALRVSRRGYNTGGLGMQWSERHIKISARQVLGVLAGTVSQSEFLQNFGMDRPGFTNPFLAALADGRLITSARIEQGRTEDDDDWIEFTFGEPDPAASPFRSSRLGANGSQTPAADD